MGRQAVNKTYVCVHGCAGRWGGMPHAAGTPLSASPTPVEEEHREQNLAASCVAQPCAPGRGAIGSSPDRTVKHVGGGAVGGVCSSLRAEEWNLQLTGFSVLTLLQEGLGRGASSSFL